MLRPAQKKIHELLREGERRLPMSVTGCCELDVVLLGVDEIPVSSIVAVLPEVQVIDNRSQDHG